MSTNVDNVPLDVRVRRLGMGNPGQHRMLSGCVVELKIEFGAGYRVYYTQRGAELILLLIGGDKSSQRPHLSFSSTQSDLPRSFCTPHVKHA